MWETNIIFDLDLWPSDLNINRDHLITMDYLPTTFEGCGTKRYWSRLAWPLTSHLDLWPDLNINRNHLHIKDYLPTKFEASRANHSWAISCTWWSRLAWPLTLNFDLLALISIGVILSSRTIYLPSLKLLGQSILELSTAQGEVDWYDLWPLPLTFWPEYL